jgi:23S rRNA pseudouridine2605 synthase
VFVETFQYFVYFKPEGVMSTMDDPEQRPTWGTWCVASAGDAFTGGRLDFNTEGLLSSQRGDLTQKLLHPKFQVPRTYQAKVQGILTPRSSRGWRGVRLEDGWATAEVTPIRKMETIPMCG